ncbi:MAG: hypothetical protein OXC10_01295 [Rhodospirillaceae bacterium]|nr:hypothetical protein [Rhodospirillaceae bacterium]
MVEFTEVWTRIMSHSGEEFRQIRGGRFTYVAREGYIEPDRTRQNLPRSHFEAAFELVPFEDTTGLQHLRGPSYLYAILMDCRIRQSDW